MSCAAGLSPKEYCASPAAVPQVCPRTPSNRMPSTTDLSTVPRACCMAMTADCLSCSAGVSVEEFCSRPNNSQYPGCERFNTPRACCMAMTADCLSCSAGVSVEEFCSRPNNSQYPGCEQVVPAARYETIYVGDHLVDCVGVVPMKCMLVKSNLADEWTYFYDVIQGFDYDPGFVYQLQVSVEEIPNPPADGSSLRYGLIEVVAKTQTSVPQPSAPSKPRMLHVAKKHSTRVALVWAAPVNNFDCSQDGYIVQYRRKEGGLKSHWKNVGGITRDTVVELHGLTPGKVYAVQVTPVTADGVKGKPARRSFATKKEHR